MSDGVFPLQRRLKPVPGIYQPLRVLPPSVVRPVVGVSNPALCRADDSMMPPQSGWAGESAH